MTNPSTNTRSVVNNSTTIPYCFNSNEEAERAELEMTGKFDNVSAYSIGKTLFVVLHFKKVKPIYKENVIDEFIKDLGGTILF